MKLIELTTDNTTKTGYLCQRVGTDYYHKLPHIVEVIERCGNDVSLALENNGRYIGECEGKCLFNKE